MCRRAVLLGGAPAPAFGHGVVLRRAVATVVHAGQVPLRHGVVQLGAAVKPDRGLARVFRDALAVVVEQPDGVDRFGIAVAGRPSIPVDRLAVVLGHVGAVFVDPAQGKLRGQVAGVARGADGGQRRAGRGIARLCCNFRAATSGWTTFGKHRTGSPIMPSDNPFKWRQFEPALILQCVRWYLRYALSYRDLEDMMRERGLCVDHTTIYRWVQRYAPEIDKRCRPFLRRTNDSYRIDETYVRVAGAWTYLYRGVDSNGDTLDFLLRATRDRKAAIAFFRKTLGAAHTTPPRVVTVDKNPAYPVAFEAVRHEGLVQPRSNLRQCKYLNNIIEQDHRFINRRTRPMLGFKRFTPAWRTLRGIEIMHALRKGQARWMAKGDVVGQTQLIHKVFGLAA